MTDDERIDALELTAESVEFMDEWPERYEALLQDMRESMKAAGSIEEAAACREILKRMKAVLHREAGWLAGLLVGRVEEGIRQGQGN